MLLQNLRAKIGARLNAKSEEGFTLIELLVVMLILGILAAIALPAFFNQKDKAGDAQAKSTAHSAQVAMETCATDNNDDYSTCNVAALEKIENTLPAETADGVTGESIKVDTATDDTYKFTVKSDTGNTFSVERESNGTMKFPCTGEGGCSGSTWSD